ncbi:LCP family protein [Actinoplanes utahensis]|nr:LCP family protein [Actinoplanes utahensis]
MENMVAETGKRRPPLWARLCVAFGVVLLLAGIGTVVAGRALVGRYTDAVTDNTLLEDIDVNGNAAVAAEPDPDIDGPLNLLLVGIDPRDNQTAPLADSIIVAHIPRDRHSAYLFSMPRDLRVEIPAFDKSKTGEQTDKINAAMSLGSRLGGNRYSVPQGFQLLAKTVGNVTGIKKFDAAAIVNFGGFKKIVEAMGGVEMVIDMDVKSEHLKPDGSPRDRKPGCQTHHNCSRPYTGPQRFYQKSDKPVQLKAWEALDYVRQRYGNAGTAMDDYDRQRHQQQFIKAMAKQAMSRDVVTNPAKLLDVMEAAGDSLTFSGGDHSIVEWALELKSLNVDDMVTVKLPAEGINSGGYQGERLLPEAAGFFQAVREDRLRSFLLDHPEFISKGK